MPENEGASLSPVEYPTLEIPGVGLVTLKYGTRATYVLDKEFQLDLTECLARLRQMLPIESGGQARVSTAFTFDMLSVLIRDQIKLTPEQLADKFELYEVPAIAIKVFDAFSKAQWSRKTAQASATTTAQPN